MSFIIYTVIMVLILLLFFITTGYKKELFRNLNKRDFKLKFIYGMAAFCLDFTNRHVMNIDYENARNKLSRINIHHSDEKDAYIYMVSKLALSIMVCVIILFYGYAKCVSSHFSKETEITELKRNRAGEGETQYNLILEYEGKRKDIDIHVGEMKYSEEEAVKIMDSYYDELKREVFSLNKSQDCVTQDLNLISELGEQIQIEWEIEDTDFVDYSGRIIWGEINDKKETEITAIMSIDNFYKSYVFNIILDKEARDKVTSILEEIDEYDKVAGADSEKLSLAEITGKYNVRFLKPKKKENLMYILAAVIFSVMIYVLKEREIDTRLDERKKQMETDYASIISKLTILQSSGMTILGAWDKIISDYDDDISKISNQKKVRQIRFEKLLKRRKNKNSKKENEKEKRYAYEEMKYARQKMKMGYSETEAYLEFGRRCGIHSYVKFAGLLEQNIKKGTKGLKEILNNEVTEAFEERKALARKRGDEAGTKLLIPMVIMLIISIVIIIVPAILSFNI